MSTERTDEDILLSLVGRAVVRIEWSPGGSWGEEAGLTLHLDDGRSVSIDATGWHDSGGFRVSESDRW